MGRLRNGLEKLVNFGKAAIVSLPLITLPYSCEPNKTHPPKVNLEISPSYGKHPLTTSIKLSGTDDDGAQDIKNYKLTIDDKFIEKNKPFDTTIIFRNYNYTKDDIRKLILGEITDSEGNTSGNYKYITIYPRGANDFVQPNDSTLNWYGSGDINGDNTVNWDDYNAMSTTANDESDIDGDGVPSTSNDKKLLNDYLTGTIDYLPGYWNLLMFWAEREDWFKKMLKIDKTNEIPPTTDFDCDQHVYQAMMNSGVLTHDEIQKFLEFTPSYDLTRAHRFNLPIRFGYIDYYDSDNKRMGKAHAIGTIALGNNSLNIGERCNFETETDALNVDISKDYVQGSDHQEFIIMGPPVVTVEQDGKKDIGLTWYARYYVKDNVFTLLETNSKLEINTEREK